MLAATAPATSAAAPSGHLPNLVALPSDVVYLGGPRSWFVDRNDQVVFGCHPTEVVNDAPTPARCLRFQTTVANLGPAPLELHFRADEVAGARGVVQRLYARDGSYRDRAAGSYVADPTHGHFHYEDFAVAALWRSDSRGRRLGRAPVRAGRKAGFCLQDGYRYRVAGPAAYTGPTSCYPTRVADGRVAQVNGISPGWVDVYDVGVTHQYIEISGVPDGDYLLEITVDPGRRLKETTTRDNKVVQRIRLCGDRAEVVGGPPVCGEQGDPLPQPVPEHFRWRQPHEAERVAFCALRR